MSVFTWNGSNPGPTPVGITGTDSSGASLPVRMTSNTSTAGTQFYVFGWGQAAQPFGPSPGADSATSSLGVFAGGTGVIASFSITAGSPPPPVAPANTPSARYAVVAARAGR